MMMCRFTIADVMLVSQVDIESNTLMSCEVP